MIKNEQATIKNKAYDCDKIATVKDVIVWRTCDRRNVGDQKSSNILRVRSNVTIISFALVLLLGSLDIVSSVSDTTETNSIPASAANDADEPQATRDSSNFPYPSPKFVIPVHHVLWAKVIRNT